MDADYIIDQIKEAMAPFRPVDLVVTVYDDPWPHADMKTVRVEIGNIPQFYFAHRLDMLNLQRMRYPEQYIQSIGLEAKKRILELPTIEIEAHIKLGEN